MLENQLECAVEFFSVFRFSTCCVMFSHFAAFLLMLSNCVDMSVTVFSSFAFFSFSLSACFVFPEAAAHEALRAAILQSATPGGALIMLMCTFLNVHVLIRCLDSSGSNEQFMDVCTVMGVCKSGFERSS